MKRNKKLYCGFRREALEQAMAVLYNTPDSQIDCNMYFSIGGFVISDEEKIDLIENGYLDKKAKSCVASTIYYNLKDFTKRSTSKSKYKHLPLSDDIYKFFVGFFSHRTRGSMDNNINDNRAGGLFFNLANGSFCRLSLGSIKTKHAIGFLYYLYEFSGDESDSFAPETLESFYELYLKSDLK